MTLRSSESWPLYIPGQSLPTELQKDGKLGALLPTNPLATLGELGLRIFIVNFLLKILRHRGKTVPSVGPLDMKGTVRNWNGIAEKIVP